MDSTTARAITWEAPEYQVSPKGGDWFFALAIITCALGIATLLLDSTLFALLIFVSGAALAIAAAKKPSIIPFAVTVRGIRINDKLYPYASLRSYHIDEEDESGPQLLVLTKRRFAPLLILPLPQDYIDDVEDLLTGRLEEQLLEEPLFIKILEKIGF